MFSPMNHVESWTHFHPVLGQYIPCPCTGPRLQSMCFIDNFARLLKLHDSELCTSQGGGKSFTTGDCDFLKQHPKTPLTWLHTLLSRVKQYKSFRGQYSTFHTSLHPGALHWHNPNRLHWGTRFTKAWFILQSPTVARLGDRRRQSCVCLYLRWRLSPAQVDDCRQQSPTVVFKVQQCWTFNAVASSRWHFPSNQRATTAFIRSRPTQTWRTQVVIKHLTLQICVCHRRPDCKSHRK